MPKQMERFKSNNEKGINNVSRNLHPSELSVFCYQMALILKSGIPMMEGMQLMAEEMMDANLKKAVQEMYQDIKMGLQYHLALEKHSIFPIYMVNMSKIGEMSGSLDQVMEHLSTYYDKMDKLNRRVRSAVTYPLILVGLMSGVILLLIAKILPMFNDILNSLGGEMPAVTKVMMDLSTYMKGYSVALVLIMLFIAVTVYIYLRTPKGKLALDKFKVEFVFTKKVFQKISVARFSMGMALILKSGIGFEEALEMASNIVGNEYIAIKIRECKRLIRNGTDTAQAIMELDIFPKLVVKVINIGYKTGTLEDAMAKIAVIYESEVENALNKLTASIEPILVIILSIVVGFILLTVMLPLINIMSSIG
jgi:type IV pilus assembly protein PilC